MHRDILNKELHGMDMSLLDQVLKGRFIPGSTILDAGFGSGRNALWFIKNNFDVYGIDASKRIVMQMRERVKGLPVHPDRFTIGTIENIPFNNCSFDAVICNAVLHFAKNVLHFNQMFDELIRVLRSDGILFVRMTSDIGIEPILDSGKQGVFHLPDGSHRFLLNRKLLQSLIERHALKFIEPLKTVNVNDMRCMSTLVLRK